VEAGLGVPMAGTVFSCLISVNIVSSKILQKLSTWMLNMSAVAHVRLSLGSSEHRFDLKINEETELAVDLSL